MKNNKSLFIYYTETWTVWAAPGHCVLEMNEMPQVKHLFNLILLQHDVGEEGYEFKTLLICSDK